MFLLLLLLSSLTADLFITDDSERIPLEMVNGLFNYHRLDDVTYQEHLSSNKAHNSTSILLLPPDVSMLINGYFSIRSIHSLIRTCRFYLYSCKQYIRNLLSNKFTYLLTQNESKVTIKQLLNIPIVDAIIVNAGILPIFFVKGTRSKKSSKYIGIDSMTGNGFISFWMRRVDINRHQTKIITVLFNATGIACIFLSDSSRKSFLYHSIKLNPLSDNESVADRLGTIISMLVNGETRGISRDYALWCLNDQWESCMFWPNLRAKFRIPPRRVVNVKITITRKLKNTLTISAVVCIVISFAILFLSFLQHVLSIKIFD